MAMVRQTKMILYPEALKDAEIAARKHYYDPSLVRVNPRHPEKYTDLPWPASIFYSHSIYRKKLVLAYQNSNLANSLGFSDKEMGDELWLSAADFALKRYNAAKGTDFEVFELKTEGMRMYRPYSFCLHLTFLAKRRNVDDSSSPQLFFAEVYYLYGYLEKFAFKLCMPLDPSSPDVVQGGCPGCHDYVPHPRSEALYEGPSEVPPRDPKFRITRKAKAKNACTADPDYDSDFS